MGIARALVRAEALGGHWRSLDESRQALRSVTPADVARVAERYFHAGNRVVGVLGPVEAPTPPPDDQTSDDEPQEETVTEEGVR